MARTTDARGVLAPCSSCGQVNRIPYAKLDRQGKCGQCGRALALLDAPVAVADSACFDSLVSQSPLPALVDFWAEWCGPCKMVAPELEKVARRAPGAW